MAEVTILLGEYYRPDDPVPMTREALDAFVRVLSPFDVDVVREACDRWRHGDKHFKPASSNLLEIANRIMNERRAAEMPRTPRTIPRPPPIPDRTDVERKRAWEIMERTGFANRKTARPPVECSVPYLSPAEAQQLVAEGRMTPEQAEKATLRRRQTP